MASLRSVVPVGAVATPAHLRGTELKKMRNSLKNVNDRHLSVSNTNKSSLEDEEKPKPLEVQLFDKPDPLTNMILVVEEIELHVHREVLAGWSPVFMAMFSGDFTETRSNKVIMHGKSIADIRLLLNILYPPNLHKVTVDNVMTLLPLADEYDISAIKSQCEDIILKQEPSLDIMLIAHEYNLPKLLEKSIENCAALPLKCIDHEQNSDLTEHIPSKYLLDIYRKKIELQGDQLKSLKKFKASMASMPKKLEQWGTARNSYPCDKHRKFDDSCAQCLKRFRAFAFDQLQSLLDNHGAI